MGDMPDDGYKTFVCVRLTLQKRKSRKEKPAHLAQSIRVAKR